jgi:hypothetical protein
VAGFVGDKVDVLIMDAEWVKDIYSIVIMIK